MTLQEEKKKAFDEMNAEITAKQSVNDLIIDLLQKIRGDNAIYQSTIDKDRENLKAANKNLDVANININMIATLLETIGKRLANLEKGLLKNEPKPKTARNAKANKAKKGVAKKKAKTRSKKA